MKMQYRGIFILMLLAGASPILAQKKLAPPQTSTVLHANRLRVGEIKPGHIYWQRTKGPDNSMPWVHDSPPFLVDFDGAAKPCAGLDETGLWLGARDSAGQVRVSCARTDGYYGHPFVTGPLSGNWPDDSLNSRNWDRFFQVSRADLEHHRADWLDNGQIDHPLPAITGWPGRANPHFVTRHGFPLPDGDLAPFVDLNGDGIYNAFDGDYPHPAGLHPKVLPGVLIWNIFNDAYGDFHQVPLGVEIHQSAWAPACDTGVLSESVFFSFRIINRSGAALDSAVAAIWMSPRIGNERDDAFGTDLLRNSVFIYGHDNTDELPTHPYEPKYAFGDNPPAFSFTSLSRPFYKCPYRYQGGPCDPPLVLLSAGSPPDFFRYLHGYWRDGKPLTFGRDGYDYDNTGNLPTDFAFPGDPNDPGSWALNNVWNYSVCSWNTEVLPVISLGRLEAGASAAFDFAFSYHRGEGLNHLQNVTYLYERVDQLQSYYDHQFQDACAYSSCVADCVWPGDTNRDGIVDHFDILPLGVGWDTGGGSARQGPCTWMPHTAPDWDVSFNNSYDFKHIDANGDGHIDTPDLNVLTTFMGLQIPGYVAPPDQFPEGPELVFCHNGPNPNVDVYHVNPVKPGFVFPRVKPANGIPLYGLAFTMVYDTAYFKFISFGGLADLSKYLHFSRQKPGEITFSAALKEQSDVFQYGFPRYAAFWPNVIPDSVPDTTLIRLKNIRGIRSDGSEIPLGTNILRYCFGNECTPAVPVQEAEQPIAIHCYPNPAGSMLIVQAPHRDWDKIEVFDSTGRFLRQWDAAGREAFELNLSGLPAGWLTLRLQGSSAAVTERIYLLPGR
ncbi:MAG: T9SS type A sorting domain-containing protein [Thermoanaerobaculia bacterium]|nr:T9SS type A sorting domain-containing protein [Thermoanaerobaculia bacterium]